MTDNKIKDKDMKQPVERHDTAAWNDAQGIQPVSNVIIPKEFEVMNAKEWVDTNQK